MDRWRVVALYTALSAAFCGPIFEQPFAAGHGDWDQHFLYYASVLRNAVFGDMPFWNPWYCGGNVLWANPQASLISPVYPLALVMPLALAMKLNVLGHYVVGCLGMHLVVRRMIGVQSAIVAIYVVSLFVFSGALVLHVSSGHTVFLPVFLLPLVTCCFWQAVGGRMRSLVLGGAILGVIVLNGGMHVLPLAAVLLGVLGLGASVIRRSAQPLVLAIAMLILGGAFGAPRIIPTLAFVQSAPFNDTRPVKSPDFMSAEMLRVSFMDGSQGPHTKFPGVQLYGWQEYGNYLGWFGAVLAAVSACWILIFRRRREHWAEASAALGLVVILLITLGEFAPYAPASLMRELPFFSSFRIPSRYTLLVPLLAAVCVAFAARALLEAGTRDSGRRRLVEILCAVFCVVGVIEIGLVNRKFLRGVFILPPVGTESRLLEPMTPTVSAVQVASPGPRVHRSYMLEAMQNGLTTLDCYEPLRVEKVAAFGPAVIHSEADVTITAPTFSPNRVTATVAVGREPARVRLNQNFADGWSSNVGVAERDPANGQPSVLLPAGFTGTVAFAFWPPGLWLGLAVWLIAVGLSVIVWRAEKSPK